MQNKSFNHSVKVPKLYKCAAKISQEVAGGSGSIKQLVYEKTHFNTKALYALVVTTFQKSKEIDLLLKRTKLLEKETRLDPWLAKILISEILWGKKQLPNSEAKPIKTIQAYEQAFRAHLSDSSGDTVTENIQICKKPRYVRVNTLINSFNEALELFQDEGWILQTPKDPNDYGSFLEQVSQLEGDFVLKDIHIPDLLIFPSGTEFYNHPGYKKGAIVLQDKASCLPVHILSPPPGSIVLDMCAAPGMKTTQLATMLKNDGTVYAVELDNRRFQVLNKIVESSGATCIKTVNKDVLDCGDSDFPDVEYVLVDPSCSASGMSDRVELQQQTNDSRLQRLAGFQIKILRSALTRYPKVKKVVYSTCSILPEENEDVVRQVLETNNNFKLVPAGNFINDVWKSYGSSDYGDIGKYCLYARAEEDFTNGFFVAVFERLEEGENNQFFNGRVLNYRKKVEQNEARKERKFRERNNENNNFGDEENYTVYEDYPEQNTIADLNNEDTISEDVKPKKTKKSKHNKGEDKFTESGGNTAKIDDKNIEMIEGTTDDSPGKNKKKRCKQVDASLEQDMSQDNTDDYLKKNIVKFNTSGTNKIKIDNDCIESIENDINNSLRKNKKKKHKNVGLEELLHDNIDISLKKPKKKKRKHGEVENTFDGNDDTTAKIDKATNENLEISKKEKRKHKDSIVDDQDTIIYETNDDSIRKKKKKKEKDCADVYENINNTIEQKEKKKRSHSEVKDNKSENNGNKCEEEKVKSVKKSKKQKNNNNNNENNQKVLDASMEVTDKKNKKQKKMKLGISLALV